MHSHCANLSSESGEGESFGVLGDVAFHHSVELQYMFEGRELVLK